MDGKRKATGDATGSSMMDDRAIKRAKPNSNYTVDDETPDLTTTFGLVFVEQIRQTKDKSGNPVATNFLTLPSKRDLPEYYRTIQMPIALDTIEEKLRLREFKNLTELESYVKRMISNAKDYNERGSRIFEDAERIRKALSNYMTKTNPAYKIQGYTAFPTPLPQQSSSRRSEANVTHEQGRFGSDIDAEGDSDDQQAVAQSSSRRGLRQVSSVDSSSATGTMLAAPSDLTAAQIAQKGFEGVSFQLAQEKILAEINAQTDDDGNLMFVDFLNLPKRENKNYYEEIKNPMSLNMVRKRVMGSESGRAFTGVSVYWSWSKFEEAVAQIWENCKQYNEDGSEISIAAYNLEKFFKKRVAEAKQVIPDAPKLKFKQPQPAASEKKVTLKLRAGSAASPAPSPGFTGPDSPLAGQATQRNPFGGSQPSSSGAVPNLRQFENARNLPGSVGYAAQVSYGGSSIEVPQAALKSYQSSQNGHAASSYPNGSMLSQSNGYAVQSLEAPMSYAQPILQPIPWREDGKTATNDGLIKNLNVCAHPDLRVEDAWSQDFRPDEYKTKWSYTQTIPDDHRLLQFRFSLNTERTTELHLRRAPTNERVFRLPSMPGRRVGLGEELYDVEINPGVNTFWIKIGSRYKDGRPGWESEECELHLYVPNNGWWY